jgi:glycosidase
MNEAKYYGEAGNLYPYDVRHDAADRAFCNPLRDGRAQIRLITEHAVDEATLVYHDDAPRAASMHCCGRDRRFLYWEAVITPASAQISYSFALRTPAHIVYCGRHGIDHSIEPLDRWTLDLEQAQPLAPPAWMRGAVVYQIFPDRFANGDPANDPPGTVLWGTEPTWRGFQGGDLQGIVAHLDHLQALGVEVLYLNPINTSPSTHKYDTVDYYHVDPALGGDEALHELVAALHARDMRILLDTSFNHCHPRFFAFQDIVAQGRASRYWNWFTIYDYPIRVGYRPHLLDAERDRRPELAEWLDEFAATTGIGLHALAGEGPLFVPSYLAWYGVIDMPKLNQQHPEARAYFLDVAAHWLRAFDIDGWRMDVTRHIAHDFWVEFRRVCKAAKPDCFLLAEVWGDASAWLQGDQFDGSMNYVLRELCVDYAATGEMGTAAFVEGLGRALARYAPQVIDVSHNLLSSHDTVRFRTAAGGDARRLRLATLLQMTLPGAPGIYYGDEVGMEGGADPGCRGAFPWHAPRTWDAETLAWTKALTRLRRDHLALREGRWQLLWVEDESFAFARAGAAERVVVLINRRRAPSRVTLPVEVEGVEVLWGEGQASIREGMLAIEDTAPWSGVVVRCLGQPDLDNADPL